MVHTESRYKMSHVYQVNACFSRVCRSATATIKSVMSFCPSVCPAVRPHRTVQLPVDEVAWNSILECFWEICLENASLLPGYPVSSPVQSFILWIRGEFRGQKAVEPQQQLVGVRGNKTQKWLLLRTVNLALCTTRAEMIVSKIR